jgi:hypothetical protein
VPAAAHASLPITIPFFDWRLEPHFDEAQDVPIDDAPGNRLQQFSVRDRVKVSGQIGVYHICVAAAEKRMHFLDCIRPTSSRAVTIGAGVKVRLEDRLKHQLGSGLYHTVPYRRHTPSELHYIPIDLWVRLKSFTHSTRGAASGLSF